MSMRRLMTAVAAGAVLSIGGAQAALSREAFDPREYHEEVAGERTQVLVLATPHLSMTPAEFNATALEGLLQELQSYHPDVIAIENLSGESLSALSAYQAVYPDVAESFGSSALALAAAARAYTDLDLPAAEAEARAALSALGAEPTAARRRRLAMLFLAAGDPNSALVQWWRLSPSERVADDFPQTMRTQLEAFAARKNESALIGARLAARLGLNRLYPMDDQSGLDLIFPIAEALGAAIAADPSIAEGLAHPEFARLAQSGDRLGDAAEALSTYREINAPGAGLVDARAQWLIMIDRVYPQSAGRVRMGEWEARNLRMAANIREAAASVPGGRVLVIVGASHKPWLDAYLDMMTDIRIVDARQVLRQGRAELPGGAASRKD